MVLRLAAALGLLGWAGRLLAAYGPRDWPAGPGDVGRWLGAGPPEVRVLAFAALAAYGCLAWLAWALLLVAAGRARWVPPGARPVARRVLGVALVTGTASALAVVSAAASATAADGPFDRPVPPRPPGAVVVAPGDTLWGIGGRAWPRWYAANRTTIGRDPDLILPGQRLAPPPGGRP
jgi:nucleoid-associated protein YgaU